MIRVRIEKIDEDSKLVEWSHEAAILEGGISDALNQTVGAAASLHDDEELQETAVEAFLGAATTCCGLPMLQAIHQMLLLARYCGASRSTTNREPHSITVTLNGTTGLAHIQDDALRAKVCDELVRIGVRIVNSEGRPFHQTSQGKWSA